MHAVDTSTSRVNALILGAFAFYVSVNILYWLPRDLFGDALDMWVYTEWLIDYSAGFTRRGLSGGLVHLASKYVHPYTFVTFLSWIIFGGVVIGYLELCARNRERLRPHCLAALLFLPSLLPFYLYDHGGFGRKETLGYLFLMIHLALLRGRRATTDDADLRRYVTVLVPLVAVLLPAYVFVHEPSFLLFTPVHVAITWSAIGIHSDLSFRKRLARTALLYLPILISFLIVTVYGRPTLDVAQTLCSKWEAAGALAPGYCRSGSEDPAWAVPYAIGAIAWSVPQAISHTEAVDLYAFVAWILVFLVLGFLTVRFCRMTAETVLSDVKTARDAVLKTHSAILTAKYFGLPVLFSLPLYPLAPDGGRWFAVACLNYAMICLSREVNVIEHEVARRRSLPGMSPVRRWRWLQLPGDSSGRQMGYRVELFTLLLVVFYVRLPHCCIRTAFLAEPLRSIVRDVLRSGDHFLHR